MLKFFLFILFLTIYSCSNQVSKVNSELHLIVREPLSLGPNYDDEIADEIFTIKNSDNLLTSSLEKNLIENLNQRFNANQRKKFFQFKAESILNSNLDSNTAFKLEFDIDDRIFKIKIHHNEKAFYDKKAVTELIVIMKNFIPGLANENIISNQYAYMELIYNAIHGDAIAADNLIEILTNAKEDFKIMYLMPSELDNSDNDKSRFLTLKEKNKNRLQLELKKRKNLKILRKKELAILDKLPEDQQFRALVARNDRQGVVELLKNYLPFEDMGPFEKRYWQEALNIIAHPVPIDQRVIIYRGIDDDRIYPTFEAGHYLDQEIAIKEGNATIMSTLMTKNQGSWNRRLRSLEAINSKKLTQYNFKNEYSQSYRLMTIFANHATDPVGSPFFSTSPDFKVAEIFGRNRIAAIAIDPRLLTLNLMSYLPEETEFLTPLTTFPDESLAFLDTEIIPEAFSEKSLKNRIEDKLLSKFGNTEGKKIYNELNTNSVNFFKNVFTLPNNATNTTQSLSYKEKFNQFTSDKKTPAAPLNEKGELSCYELINLFWK